MLPHHTLQGHSPVVLEEAPHLIQHLVHSLGKGRFKLEEELGEQLTLGRDLGTS